MHDTLENAEVRLDPETIAYYLEVPRNQVILLQTYFELYDGVGTVRTLEGERAVVCVLTTPSMAKDCRGVLEAIREQVAWIACEPPALT
jgi:hypothetical protein